MISSHLVTVISLIALHTIQLPKESCALRWQLSYLDGPCPKKPYKPVKIAPDIMDSFKYIAAGSKLLIYSGVTQLPNYGEISEDEFYYDLCLTHNASTATSPKTSIFGFGSILQTFNVTAWPGRYRNVPVNPKQSWMTLEETVTLTDGKSFIFLSSCVPKLNLKAWSVNTISPTTIDSSKRRLIEAHAKSLGFNKDNFVFLRYESCKKGLIRPFYEARGHTKVTRPASPRTPHNVGWARPRKPFKRKII